MPIDLARDVVLRWETADPEHVPLFKQASINAVLVSAANPAFAQSCSAAGIAVLDPSDIQFVPSTALGSAKPGAGVALTDGIWPGIARPPAVAGRGDETASASVDPWVDANGYWIGYMRALYPKRPPVLGYLPDKLGDRSVPYDSLELALIEAWTAGGNYLLALEPNYRGALLRNEPRAKAAWAQLGTTARWLQENIALFRQPVLPVVTALVDSGEATAEIGNLLYRRNVSPALCAAAALPPPAPENRLALVAADLVQSGPDLIRRLIAHAQAGTSVITAGVPREQLLRNGGLKPVRSEPDREFFAAGKGQVIAYRSSIDDPSEFALDVIDIITHKRRAVRLWNAPAAIALVTDSPRRGERLLHVINYGAPLDMEVQARVQGHFTKAMLLRPDGTSTPLAPARRGTTTEVFLPGLKRVAVVLFS
jgi:hypothetical protein